MAAYDTKLSQQSALGVIVIFFFLLLQIKWEYFGVSGFPAYCYFSEFVFASVIEYAQDRTQLEHEDKPHLLE